jgi:hypothetical protein
VRIATGIVTNRSITRTDMSPMRTILIAMSNKRVVLAVAAAAFSVPVFRLKQAESLCGYATTSAVGSAGARPLQPSRFGGDPVVNRHATA